MVAWGELATKTSLWAPAGTANADTAAPNISLPRQHEATESYEPWLSPTSKGGSFSLSTSSFSNHSRIPSSPLPPPEGGGRVSSCSDQVGGNQSLLQVSSGSGDGNSRSASEGAERGGYGAKVGGDWVSTSSVQRGRARSDGTSGGIAVRGARDVGLAAQWPEVAQGVSERAEEILNRAGSGGAGRFLEVRYRLKQA